MLWHGGFFGRRLGDVGGSGGDVGGGGGDDGGDGVVISGGGGCEGGDCGGGGRERRGVREGTSLMMLNAMLLAHYKVRGFENTTEGHSTAQRLYTYRCPFLELPQVVFSLDEVLGEPQTADHSVLFNECQD